MADDEKIVDGLKAIRDDLKKIVDDQSENELDDDHVTIKGVLVKDGIVHWHEHVEIVPDIQFVKNVNPLRHSLTIMVEHQWNGMSCHVCSRGQHDINDIINGCDLCVPGVRDDGYCALFVAYEDRIKSKREMRRMMESHNQRWIRERSNFN